jgi:ionotropic glutamate receptor
VIEHRINPEFRGTPLQQFGIIFHFAFSTLVFSHSELNPPCSGQVLQKKN